MSVSAIPALPTTAFRPGQAVALRLRNLTKRYSSRGRVADALRGRRGTVTTVVDGVSFEVGNGEIFGVLGPNGAGKTTIFKMLATLVLPDDGTAEVCGHDIWLDPGRVRSALAAVPADERSLNWRLSARENLLLFAALHQLRRAQAEQAVNSALATVELDAVEPKMVSTFSSGMRQRLLIARALLARPRVLLLDEPTRALDPISAEEFRRFLRQELVDRQQCTILLATHNAEEALAFCDRVVVLDRGRVLAIGTASELKSRFGEDRYRILTSEPNAPCLARLEATGLLRRSSAPLRTVDGWSVLECVIPGDPVRTSQVLETLVASGTPIARFERVEPSLADLIGRIIGRISPKVEPNHA